MQRDDYIHERLADRLANILTKLNIGYQLSIKELASFVPNPDVIKQVEDEDSIWFGQDKKEVILSIHAEVVTYFKQRRLLPEQ